MNKGIIAYNADEVKYKVVSKLVFEGKDYEVGDNVTIEMNDGSVHEDYNILAVKESHFILGKNGSENIVATYFFIKMITKNNTK